MSRALAWGRAWAGVSAGGLAWNAARGLFIYGPCCLVAGMAAWVWVVEFGGWNWWGDADHYMYFGQRLAAGHLPWTGSEGYNDRLLAAQFPFVLAGHFGNFRVYQLTAAACILSGCGALYYLARQIFSEGRGFAPGVGHWIGLYGGALMAYMLMSGLHPLMYNPMVIGLALAALGLCRFSVRPRHSRASGSPGKNGIKQGLSFWIPAFAGMTRAVRWTPFILGALLGSLAVGIRPYLLLFVALIPLWCALAARGERDGGGLDWRGAAGLFLLWNLLAGLFGVLANVAPYLVAGETDALRAGIALLGQQLLQGEGFTLLYEWEHAQPLTLLLYGAFTALIVLYAVGYCRRAWRRAGLRIGLWTVRRTRPTEAPRAHATESALYKKPVALDLCFLALLSPLAIQLLIATKYFHRHYIQFFQPMVALCVAAGLVLLIHGLLQRLGQRRQRIAVGALLLAALVAFAPQLPLRPLPRDLSHFGRLLERFMNDGEHRAQANRLASVRWLLDRHDLQDDEFLAPRNMHVHWKFRAPRHGFPHAEHSLHIIQGWWEGLQPPPVETAMHLPKTPAEHCELLDDYGPPLVVYLTSWVRTRLVCEMENYDYMEAVYEGAAGNQQLYYYLRKP